MTDSFSTRPTLRRATSSTISKRRSGPASVALAAGYEAVCIFVNDVADASVLEALQVGGTGLVALRSTGFNNVDLAAASRLGVKVVRVVDYSPHSTSTDRPSPWWVPASSAASSGLSHPGGHYTHQRDHPPERVRVC